MSKIMEIIADFTKACDCGRKHETAIRDIHIASGLVHHVGEILRKNQFSENLLLVADKNTLKAAEGIEASLAGFSVEYKIYDNLRVTTMEHVKELEALLADRDISVLSVGTGSINDACRLAAANRQALLCVFATAPSMDGFASYGAPIVCDGFKVTCPAKSPEVIIGDTAILAAAPGELKSAGFGDMVAKYVGLIDWQISTLLTGEYYCDKIASLTKEAADELMDMADQVTKNDEYTAGKIFEALLKTGIGMSFAQNSRPASGSEHIISHLMECIELRENIIPNLHGDDVGVGTLAMLRYYRGLAKLETVETQKETVNWNDVYRFYGSMAEEVRRLNEPENVIDEVDPEELKEKWLAIVRIICSMPDYAACEDAMRRAGCKLTVEDIQKNRELFNHCIKYSPYMRKRLTLLRLKDMLKTEVTPYIG